MKHQAFRWLRLSLGLLLFAAGGGQPGGFDLVAQQIQLSIEYEPEPPFDAGSPLSAPPVVVELARATSRFARIT